MYHVTVNPQTGDSSATLLYHTGDIQLPTAGLAAQGGRIVFFNQPDVFPPNPVAKDKTRIWFTFINSLGVSYIPARALAYIELGIASQKIQGIPVIIASQTLYGRVHPLVYTNLRKLSVELGCIFVEDMLPETAYVKLGWVLAKTKDPEKVKELMLTNIAGEISERSLDKEFLY